VVIYYDDTKIGESSVQDDVQEITQDFTNGKVLKLRDEGNNSVISLISFSICGTPGKRICYFIKCGRNSLVGFFYTRKEAEKDVGKFTILFVARLFTF
jgi:hypothetical protein